MPSHGEVWLVDLGMVQKARPALILIPRSLLPSSSPTFLRPPDFPFQLSQFQRFPLGVLTGAAGDDDTAAG